MFGLAILAIAGSIIFLKQVGLIGMAFANGIVIACVFLNMIFSRQQDDLAVADT